MPEDLTDEQRTAVMDRVRELSPAEVDNRLLELASYGRPTAMQRAEHRVLAERQIREAALAAQGIDVRNLSGADLSRIPGEQVGRPGTFATANRPAGRRPGSAALGAHFDQAARVLDSLHGRGLPDDAAAVCDGLIRGADRAPESARTLAQQWMSVAGSAEYESAFCRMIADPISAPAEMDDRERAAWRAAHSIRNALGEDGSGSALVPVQLDPSIMLTSAGTINPLRQVARTVRIATSEWRGVSSAGVVAEWVAEHGEASDGTPSLSQPTVPVHRLDCWVPFSVELEGDQAALLGELGTILRDSYDVLTSTAFTTGSGTGQPSGLIPGATSIATATAGTFAAADVYATQNALPPRFSAGASWLGNIAVLNLLSQFTTPNGSRQFPEVSANPPALLRKPLRELSDMSASATTTGSRFLAYGDYQKAFVIADRIGTVIEVVPTVFGPNQRPTGDRGLFMWARTGSAVVNAAAVRVLTGK